MGSLYRRKHRQLDGTIRESPIWWIKFYANGRAIRESTETTKDTIARRILRSREGDAEHGLPVGPKVGKITFEEAAADIVNDYTANSRQSLPKLKGRLQRHLTPAFRNQRMSGITTADIRKFIVARQGAGASAAEVNRELSVLKRMFTLAVQAGKLHRRPHIPMLRENNVRQGFFEREQFEAVLAHLPEALRPVVAFAYATGWRVTSEVLPMEWRQVDFAAGEVRLDAGSTKNGDGRVFPFTADLRDLLEGQRAAADVLKGQDVICRWVFHRDGRRIRSFRGAWATACRSAGCPDRIVHDFRRTAVRNLERSGVPRATAMAMVGHKTESVYRRYCIVSAGDLKDAVRKLDAAGTSSGTTPASKLDHVRVNA
jgi:integrase